MNDVCLGIKIAQASLFWVGFIKGRMDEIEWEPGEYQSWHRFGIEFIGMLIQNIRDQVLEKL